MQERFKSNERTKSELAKKFDNIKVDLKETKKLIVEVNEQMKKILLEN